MDSVSTFVLSIFAKNDRFGTNIMSLRRRYQALSIIYVNFSVIILLTIFTAIYQFLMEIPNAYVIFVMTLPLLLLNIYWIRAKRLNCAVVTLILAFHISNKGVSDVLDLPIVSITAIILYPYFIFFGTSSIKVYIFNIVLCFGQFFYNIKKIMKIFEVTLEPEQSRQIISLNYMSFFLVTSICVASAFQKMMESNVWSIAHENHEKSEKLTKEVVQAMEAKDAFISMVSHEIRNPLNALKVSIDYLLQVVKDSSQLSVLKNAKMSGEVLLNLVNNVLDAAKLKSDKMEISRTETDLTEVVKKVFTINSEALREKSIFAKAHIDSMLPKTLWLDSSRILQILMNLLSNAIKFTPKGGRVEIYVSWCCSADKETLLRPIVEMSGEARCEDSFPQREQFVGPRRSSATTIPDDVESTLEQNFYRNMFLVSRYQFKTQAHIKIPDSQPQDPWEVDTTFYQGSREEAMSPQERNSNLLGYLKIQVLDTGCGILEEELPKLFQMFEQSSQHSRTVSGGTGLGLWICKQLCQKMNGDIAIYSKITQGTSFVLYLPVGKSQVECSRGINPHRQQIKVLVVDDFPTNRYLHKMLLEQQGVQVTTAEDGREALQKCQARADDPFTFIMMDVQMPMMDGFTATKKLREWEADNRKPQTPIYFVTGEYFNEEDVLRRFRDAGGSSNNENIKCLKKPLDAEVLTNIINEFR